jgi:hypothetical protein
MLLFTEQFPETAHLKSMPVRSLGEGGSNFPPRSLLSGEISPRADRSQIKGRIMLTADSQLGG